MELGAAIATLLGIVLWGLKQWQAKKVQQEASSADTNAQEIRKALSENDSVGVSVLLADQHDRVSEALCCDPSGGNNPGKQNPVGPAVSGQREPVKGSKSMPG
jgi:hypothetical protein